MYLIDLELQNIQFKDGIEITSNDQIRRLIPYLHTPNLTITRGMCS
ncbi:MAG: hypothetical protein ACI8P9_005221, partial [Parasphingorhabdus sp.]